MGNTGLFASKYFLNSNSLKQFSGALRYLKHSARSNSATLPPDSEIQKLLAVLQPLHDALEGNIAKSMMLDGQSVVEILNQKHPGDWQRYKIRISEIKKNLEAGSNNISMDDIDVLEDVADAMDIECGILFRRISGK